MKKSFKKTMYETVSRLPSPKLHFALVVALLIAVVLYLSILFLVSK
jgi:hypothetical protein